MKLVEYGDARDCLVTGLGLHYILLLEILHDTRYLSKERKLLYYVYGYFIRYMYVLFVCFPAAPD